MRIVGTRKEREISFHARGDLLREGAVFNTQIQKFQSSLRFPQGVFRYASHEEADRHWIECIVGNVVAVQEARRAG